MKFKFKIQQYQTDAEARIVIFFNAIRHETNI
jgi:hypothetical protein